ncbi:hypothetical protein HK100_007981 [Physocladia obscura]|uniref:Large ribosomal subunit protein uL4m n=1 Tax=Physocladia obscura TaxID=109957 RepID=A0AAD5SQU4_9FUNG|nr:hypothetical protein HK100_007981 [Physocladia obscura]
MECFLRSFKDGGVRGILQLNATVFGGGIVSGLDSGGSGLAGGKLGLGPAGVGLRTDLLHRAMQYETAWRAQGTESSKALGQVRGSTRKPFAQKGRGKARVGTLRTAHFVGGYAAHGPRPGVRAVDIPHKVYNAAIRAALAAKYTQNQLIVVDSLADRDIGLSLDRPEPEFDGDDLSLDNLSLDANDYRPKAALLQRLRALDLVGRKAYFLCGDAEPPASLTRAADLFTNKPRHHPADLLPQERKLLVTSANLISVLPVLENEFLVLDKAAVERLEEMYAVE